MIFKKKIADNLEEKVISLMYKYKKDLETNRIAGGKLYRASELIWTTSLASIVAVPFVAGTLILGVEEISNLNGISALLAGAALSLVPPLGFLGVAAAFNDCKKSMEMNNKVDLKNEFEYKMNSLLKGVDEEHPAVKRFLINKISIDKVGEKIIKMAKENKMPTVKKNNKLKP